MDAASASSGPDEALDVESEHLWRAEEEAAEEEIRMAEEAAAEAAEELWMAEEAAAQEMAELEEFAQEAEHWLSEDPVHSFVDTQALLIWPSSVARHCFFPILLSVCCGNASTSRCHARSSCITWATFSKKMLCKWFPMPRTSNKPWSKKPSARAIPTMTSLSLATGSGRVKT